jgi:molecular chaperone GrpE (heat shock protein)
MARDEEERTLQEKQGEEGAKKSGEEAPPEKSSRFDNAKAFFRALNAGADVAADDFGINLQAGAAGAGDQGGGPRGPCMSCKSLESQLAAAEAKASEHENLYKRMAADFENYRKRNDRERDETLAIGIQKGLEAVLPAMDDLDRAQSSFNENSEPKAVLESLKLIYNRFHKCFDQLGVKPLEVLGTVFDPRLHEPVQQVATNDVPEGHIAHELRRGYAIKDRVLRPALVNVAVPKDEEEEVHAAAPVEVEATPQEVEDAPVVAEAKTDTDVTTQEPEPITTSEAEPKPDHETKSAKSKKADKAAHDKASDLSDSPNKSGHIEGAQAEKKKIEPDPDIDPTTMTADLPVIGPEYLTEAYEEPSRTYDISDTDEVGEASDAEIGGDPGLQKTGGR